MKFKFIPFGLALFFQSQLKAQTKLSAADETVRYSLTQCIDYALEHNVTLRQTQLGIESAIVRLNQAKAQQLPTVNGQYNANSNFGRNIDPFSNSIVTNAIATNSLGAAASVPIYQGKRIQNNIALSTLDAQAARMDYQAQKNNISLQVAIAYLNVLQAEDVITVSQKNLEVSNLQLERTKRLVEAGSLAETNLFDLTAQIANDELNLVNAENSYQSAILTLKQAMNLTENISLGVQRTQINDPSIELYPETPEEVYQAAINYLPEITANDLREQMAQKNLEIAHAVGLPRISGNASWGSAYSTAAQKLVANGTTNQQIPVTVEFEGQTVPLVLNMPQTNFNRENIPYFNQIFNNQNVNLGFSVQVPIFNGYNRKYQEQGAKIQQMQSSLNSESTKLSIRQNIDQSYINMLNASKTYTANLIQVEALQKSFEAADTRYNAGAANFVDYNLAKSNLDRANANLIRAKYDYLFRIKILDFYQNKPLNF